LHEPGHSLSHYRLVEQIGAGGMGGVWKALDTKLHREIAIKILPEDVAGDPEKLSRFENEARAVAALNHPNIVTLHSVEEADGVHFITMELVRGRTLADTIPRGGMPLRKFLELAVPLADAVYSAHQRGLTHRDLKPANVMLSDEGRVKVLDFGLARFREPEVSPDDPELPTKTLTQEREIRGTMPYMSPEQVKGKKLDQRTDLFSLGVILYEMATGERPFAGETSADLIASILRDEPRGVSVINNAMPPSVARWIAQCLRKDPRQRLDSARELRDRLERLRLEEQTGDVTVQPRQAGVEVRSELHALAVLPLHNLSGDHSQEFFADGMTDALITDLAKIRDLKVISRTSVMQYKGARKPLREISEELGVGAVVEGSVLRSGDRVRITAQLIDARSDEHLWAESYDREIANVLEVQGEVAAAIADRVLASLSDKERERLAGGRTVCPEAHEACLKGRHFWHKRTTTDVRIGLQFFRQATELDPAYAPAWAGVADSYLVDGGRYLGVPADEAYGRAREAAQRALELDEALAEAHSSLGGVLSDYDWNWTAAQRSYERAIELNPNYATGRYWYADHLARVGRHDDAVREVQLANELDPLSVITNHMVAWVLYFARRFEEAAAQARRTLDLDDDYVAAQRVLGWACEELGRVEEAIAVHERAVSISGGSPLFKGPLGRAQALAGRESDARGTLQELLAASRTLPVSPLDVAVIHAALGEVDEAFQWLERACDEHSDHVPYLGVSPRLDGLRDDPRFHALLSRVGLDADGSAG
jgi:serine/threonine protein kinase/tetratricopeptide (TPR) repeat protein